ncbi:MAG: hypothetical protein E5X21_28515 [Mesorhizobium sp.]|nr:MAG: hypothetical protein E5X21_28515 [Mesorhizobium sp.]TIR79908.1 MAG: hypothetical protein E5X15_05745 [Mesorhizobium sp.]
MLQGVSTGEAARLGDNDVGGRIDEQRVQDLGVTIREKMPRKATEGLGPFAGPGMLDARGERRL